MKKKSLALIATAVMLVAVLVVGGTLAYFTDTEDQTNTFTVGKVGISLTEQRVGGNGEEDRTSADQAFGTIVPGHVFVKDPTIKVDSDSQNSYIFLDLKMNKYKSLVPVMAAYGVEKGYITKADYDACMGTGSFSTKTFLGNMAKKPAAFRSLVDDWFGGITHTDWKVCGFFYDTQKDNTTEKGNWMTIRLAYVGSGKPIATANQEIEFMSSFQMPKEVTQDMINKTPTANHFNEGDPFQLIFKAYAIQADGLPTSSVDGAFSALFSDTKNGDAANPFWNAIG